MVLTIGGFILFKTEKREIPYLWFSLSFSPGPFETTPQDFVARKAKIDIFHSG
jgi:hypothetical protein